MKRVLKCFAIFVLSVFATLTQTGCTQEEQELVKAITKTMHSTSMENSSRITVNLDAKVDDADREYFDTLGFSIWKGLKKIELITDSHFMRSEDDLVSKQATNIQLNVGGIAYTGGTWTDVDLHDSQKKFKQMFHIPSLMTAWFPVKYAGREYLEFDTSVMEQNFEQLYALTQKKFSPLTKRDVDELKNIFTIALEPQGLKNVTKESTAFIETFVKGYSPGLQVVKKLGQQEIQGGLYTSYAMRLDDKQSKELLKSMIIALLESKEFRDFIKARVQVSGLDPLDVREFEEFLDSLDKELPEFKKNLDIAFEFLKDIQLLGKKGIDLQFGVNKDGYLAFVTGDIHIEFNPYQLANIGYASSPRSKKDQGSMDTLIFNINLESKNVNINKVTQVVYPERKSEEKLSISDLVEFVKDETRKTEKKYKQRELEVDERVAAYGGVSLKIDGERVGDSYGYGYDETVLIREGRMMAQVAAILNAMEISFEWLPENRQIVCYQGDKTIIFTIDQKEVSINGIITEIETPPTIINERTYLPVRSLCEVLGLELQWDPELRIANMITK